MPDPVFILCVFHISKTKIHSFFKSSLRNRTFEAFMYPSYLNFLTPPPEIATIFNFVFIICLAYLMILSNVYVPENTLLSFLRLKHYKNEIIAFFLLTGFLGCTRCFCYSSMLMHIYTFSLPCIIF